ncbi:MAG TPA: DUF5522 domain-containing protein [Chitinophagales bacterium]|nr:DUF5522 domain-containing protein [Chitinophagales bacterium]
MESEQLFKSKNSLPLKKELVRGEDYYINENNQWVFTSTYHLKRGYCCKNGCLHCPYQNSAL